MSIRGAARDRAQLSSQGGATRFKKGRKRRPRAGRRSGVPSKATREIAVFIAVLHLGYGKPKPAKDEVAQPRRPLWIVLSRPAGCDPLADHLGPKPIGATLVC